MASPGSGDASNEDRFFHQRRTVLAFLDFLRTASLPPTIDPDALEVASDCLSEAFGVSPQNPDDLERFLILPGTLFQLIQDHAPGSLPAHSNLLPSTAPAATAAEPMDEGHKGVAEPRASGSASGSGEGSAAAVSAAAADARAGAGAAEAKEGAGEGAETGTGAGAGAGAAEGAEGAGEAGGGEGSGGDVEMKEAAEATAKEQKQGGAGEGVTAQETAGDRSEADEKRGKEGKGKGKEGVGSRGESVKGKDVEVEEEEEEERVDMERKLQEFLAGLESANYYAGTVAGSEEYLERQRQAKAIFYQCIEQQEQQAQPAAASAGATNGADTSQKEKENESTKESKGKEKEQEHEGAAASGAAAADAAGGSAGTAGAAGRAEGTASAAMVTEEDKRRAEELKAQGNAAMAAKQFEEALSLYSQAITLCAGTNAIYYANRAAAQHQLGNFMAAVADSKRAIEVDPSYSKAYSRLGHAYMALGRNHEAIEEGFKKALQLDPANATHKENLKAAKRRVDEQRRDSAFPHADPHHQHYHQSHPHHHHHSPPPFAFPGGMPFGGFSMPMGMPGPGMPGVAGPSFQAFMPGPAPGEAAFNISMGDVSLDPSDISGVLGVIQSLVGGMNVPQQSQQQQQPPPA